MTLPEVELSFYFAAAAQLEPALRPAFTERVVTILQSHADPGPGDVEPCSPTSTDRAVGPAGRDRAAATALASRYAGFRAGIEAGLIGGAAACSAKRKLSLLFPVPAC